MSASTEELGGPVAQPKEDAPANEDGSIGSDSGCSVSAQRVYAMHGLLLSGIELALTVGNALKLDSFQLNSFSDLIFGGSVVIEAVGFLFAVVMASRVLLYPVGKSVVGVGVPALVIVEASVVEGGDETLATFCIVGLYAQSLCFLVFAVVSWISSPTSFPTVSAGFWITLSAVCGLIFYACLHEHSRPGGTIKEFMMCVLLSVPFAVEISESALLFTSDSTTFVAYLLAVLDLVIIFPAALGTIYAAVIFAFKLLC